MRGWTEEHEPEEDLVWWERMIGRYALTVRRLDNAMFEGRIECGGETLHREEIRSDNLDGVQYLIEKETERMLRSALDDLCPPEGDKSAEARARSESFRLVERELGALSLDVVTGATPGFRPLPEGQFVWAGYGDLEGAVDRYAQKVKDAL